MPKTNKPKMTASETIVANMLRNDGMCAAAGPMAAAGAASSVASTPKLGKRKRKKTTMRTHRAVT